MYFDLQKEPRELARGWIISADPAQRASTPKSTNGTRRSTGARCWQRRSRPARRLVGQRRARRALGLGRLHRRVGSNTGPSPQPRRRRRRIVSDDMPRDLMPRPGTTALQFPDAGGTPRRLAGITLPGAPPLLTAGSNGHVAWGYTNAYGDFLDLVELQADPADPARCARRTAGSA
jgi:penicillin amidase